MAMIARLQEEKAAVLMDARQFKRMAEEREIHLQEAIAFLKEMLVGKEEESMFLKNELLAFRQMFLKVEDKGSGKEFDCINYLEEVRTLGNKRTESTHFTEGLKSWPSSFRDSMYYSGTAPNNCSGEKPKEELLKSEFVARTGREKFQGLIADGVRSNLVNIFERAGEVLEKSPTCTAEDPIGEHQRSDNRFDRTLDSITGTKRIISKGSANRCWNEVKSGGERIDLEVCLTEDVCDPVCSGQSLKVRSGFRKVVNTPVPSENDMLGGRVESSGSVRQDSTLSLWERIRKLEHRLDTFGTKKQYPENGFVADSRNLFNVASYQEEFCCREQISSFAPEKFVGETDCPERAAKNNCREGLQNVATCLNSSVGNLETERKCACDMHCKIWSAASEQHCDDRVGDIGEGVHDIYEVHHKHNQRSECFKPLVNGNKMENQNDNRLGKPDLPPKLDVQNFEIDNLEEQKAVVTEIGETQGSHLTGNIFSVMSRNETPPCSIVTRNEVESLSGEDVWQLTLRLQSLEAERIFMNQAIASLRKENGELKLLQEIAQQLRDLKGTVNTSKQSKGHLQQEQLSFLSFFKGLLSYVSCSIRSQGSNLACSSKNVEFGVMQRNHVGLCYLLEKSPYCRTSALMSRELKVKVPIAREGDWHCTNAIFA